MNQGQAQNFPGEFNVLASGTLPLLKLPPSRSALPTEPRLPDLTDPTDPDPTGITNAKLDNALNTSPQNQQSTDPITESDIRDPDLR